MKKIFYEKIGRKYSPVTEYDDKLLEAMPKGAHLIIVYPGGRSTRYNIDPNYAAMIAAGRVAEDAIVTAISEASKLRCPERAKQPITEGQLKAWKKLQKEMGVDNYPLEWPSYREIADTAIKAMMLESEKLLENPTVKNAYDHFMLVCKLAKEQNEI